jgi:hypothetical protein
MLFTSTECCFFADINISSFFTGRLAFHFPAAAAFLLFSSYAAFLRSCSQAPILSHFGFLWVSNTAAGAVDWSRVGISAGTQTRRFETEHKTTAK